MTEMTTEHVPSEHVPADQVEQQVEVNGNVEVTARVEVIGDSEVGAEAELHAEGESVEVTADPVDQGDDSEVDNGRTDAEVVGDDTDDSSDDNGDDDEHGTPAEGSGAKKATALRRLEEEGEVAADYLEELLDIVDLDGDIDIDVENGRASVAIVAESGTERDLRRLVGSRGEVLEALQDLARLAVQARTGERSRLMLDVAGFRAARRRALEDIAARACQEVSRTGAPIRLDPMSAFERKVVHDVVAHAGLVSESEGEDPGRRVVIHPAAAG
jgi:spoIIIJ-associated protein